MAAAAYEVEAQPIIEWFRTESIWDSVTPRERAFLEGSQHTESERIQFQWKQEAQWALLWMIHRVESLGLPTRYCDTRRLVDEIIPRLSDDLQTFISQSQLRSPEHKTLKSQEWATGCHQTRRLKTRPIL